jgi:hypothetical protein
LHEVSKVLHLFAEKAECQVILHWLLLWPPWHVQMWC